LSENLQQRKTVRQMRTNAHITGRFRTCGWLTSTGIGWFSSYLGEIICLHSTSHWKGSQSNLIDFTEVIYDARRYVCSQPWLKQTFYSSISRNMNGDKCINT